MITPVAGALLRRLTAELVRLGTDPWLPAHHASLLRVHNLHGEPCAPDEDTLEPLLTAVTPDLHRPLIGLFWTERPPVTPVRHPRTPRFTLGPTVYRQTFEAYLVSPEHLIRTAEAERSDLTPVWAFPTDFTWVFEWDTDATFADIAGPVEFTRDVAERLTQIEPRLRHEFVDD